MSVRSGGGMAVTQLDSCRKGPGFTSSDLFGHARRACLSSKAAESRGKSWHMALVEMPGSLSPPQEEIKQTKRSGDQTKITLKNLIFPGKLTLPLPP